MTSYPVSSTTKKNPTDSPEVIELRASEAVDYIESIKEPVIQSLDGVVVETGFDNGSCKIMKVFLSEPDGSIIISGKRGGETSTYNLHLS
jgi:hypothetical protein